MCINSSRGTVLIACMLLLALLSLLGAGSMLTASLDAKLAGNQTGSKEAFYAAEAALEVGVGKVMDSFINNLAPFTPDAQWTEPDTANDDPYSNPFNGYTTKFRIINPDPANQAVQPDPYIYTTVENAQEIIHFSYMYTVEATAEDGNGHSKTLSETLRVLETPLVQYYIFFHETFGFHPAPYMKSWGRVHTNGDLYLAPMNGLDFNDFDESSNPSPNTLTVGGQIIIGKYPNEGGGTGNRTNGGVNVRVDSGYVGLNTAVNASNQATEEAKFVDSSGQYHVKIGVDKLPTPTFKTLSRGGFYDEITKGPKLPDVDGMRILVESGTLKIYFTPNGGAEQDVTDLIYNYEVDGLNTKVDFSVNPWPAGARTLADGTVVNAVGDMIAGTIVYSAEAPLTKNPANVAAYNGLARGGSPDSNPYYPCVLERADPREVREVDLTVIDMQRLQLWYRDYMDWSDNSAFDGSTNAADRSLVIYASRSLSGGGFATGSGVNAMQAIKIIGSRAGRTRDDETDRQTSPTLQARTTFATDNPLYMDGDFNAPGASGGSKAPGAFGCAIISDATTMLSNRWGVVHKDNTGGAYNKPSSKHTTYNAAFFHGRFDYKSGGSGETAGIHNFPRFVEDWGYGAAECNITGCLINLWFSQQADTEFKCCGTGTADVYQPPQRNYGWDVGFINPSYWPPYVPSIFSVERTSWQEM